MNNPKPQQRVSRRQPPSANTSSPWQKQSHGKQSSPRQHKAEQDDASPTRAERHQGRSHQTDKGNAGEFLKGGERREKKGADRSSNKGRFDRNTGSGRAERRDSFQRRDTPHREDPRREPAHRAPAAQAGFDGKDQRLNETRLYGINACRETFKLRSDEVIKLYLDEETAPKFADVMKYLARNRKAYHVVDADELEKIAGSQHHGGVVMVVRRKPLRDMASYLAANAGKATDCLLALDGVGNPHNLGAIMRSCAHFGVAGIVMTEAGLLQSGAAARTAEGGMEHVEGIRCDRLTDALQECRQAGYSIITTSSHGGESLYRSSLPAKVVVVFGEEMDGVSKAVASRADIGVQIPGTGLVESLNVSVAASLILGEWYRQQR
ncbi:tRNA/rRNA methyltransferase [Shewanella litorisediminis]|uniref:tRNA/rRNA methyltransferase n=1 Tax=Shewanella litorisediminis TaxID=1173586 RepID=UPI001EF1589D|nr:tRNA/rRNA methyltransferase [Shewanella litorisediminis]MCL2918133.1 tRNA/rRNA methyltransferase [Shewanella litorisediminis]